MVYQRVSRFLEALFRAYFKSYFTNLLVAFDDLPQDRYIVLIQTVFLLPGKILIHGFYQLL